MRFLHVILTGIFSEICAQIYDWNLRNLCQAHTVLEIHMGEILAELKETGLNKLGYVRIGDFAREELGISQSAGYELLGNAMMLNRLPLVKEACLKGEISKSALEHLSKIVNEENQQEWIEKARKLTERALSHEVKNALKEQIAGHIYVFLLKRQHHLANHRDNSLEHILYSRA